MINIESLNIIKSKNYLGKKKKHRIYYKIIENQTHLLKARKPAPILKILKKK